MQSNTPKVVITGGLGFIFSYVTEYFVKKGWQVVVIDDKSTGSNPQIVDGSFKFIEMDCADLEVQDIIVSENPDYLIHASAITDVDFSIKDPEFTLRQNVLSTINVFEAARFLPNLKKFLVVSTDEVYGECLERKSEEDILFSKNPYSITKAFNSLMRIGFDNTYQGLKDKTCETRFCNVFGPRQDNRKVLSRVITSVRNNEPLPVHNDGKGSREYIYVKNIPPIIDLLLEKGDRVYNVTLNDSYTVNALVAKCEEVLGRTIAKTEAHRPGMDIIYQMTNDRILSLGWTPLYTFEEGLTEYFQHEKIL